MTEQREPVKLVRDILKSELGLAEERILLDNQQADIPKDGLYVVLRYVDGKAIGSNTYETPTDDGMQETQEVSMNHTIQIDLLSFDSSARTRKEEVIMALSSTFSEQVQEENDIQISGIPSGMVNVSEVDETAVRHWYMATIAVKAVHRKQKAVPYFDSFKAKTTTDLDPAISDPEEVSLND